MLGKKSPNDGFSWDRISKKSHYVNKQNIIIPISREKNHQKVIHLFASHQKKLNPQLVSSLNLQGIQVCQITFRIHHLDTVDRNGPFCFFVGERPGFPKILKIKNTVPNSHKLFGSAVFSWMGQTQNVHSVPFSFSNLILTSGAPQIICHQPRFPWNKGSHFPSYSLPFGGYRSCFRLHWNHGLLESQDSELGPIDPFVCESKKNIGNLAFRPSGRSHCPWSCHRLSVEDV